MSYPGLFGELQEFCHSNLKKVRTVVTNQDGKQFVETLNEGEGYTTAQQLGCGHGFVVDDKADLGVGSVLDNLIFGSQDLAMEIAILEEYKVTHILNSGYKIPNYFESQFVYKNVDIRDIPDEDIRTYFDECFQFIDKGRKNGCVLVHCNAGVSRSATIAIAYLMNRNRLRFQEAFELAKKTRPSIRPNDGFMLVLKEYDKFLFS